MRYASKYLVGNDMERIWEFFENLNELVYVTDMDTYEVVYMNRCALRAFGIGSVEEIRGRKCYEVLQGNLSPCATCTNRILREGYFEEWKFRNPVLGRNYSLKDTMLVVDGRRLRMEIAIDIDDDEVQEEQTNGTHSNEAMINEGYINICRLLSGGLHSMGQNRFINFLMRWRTAASRGWLAQSEK